MQRVLTKSILAVSVFMLSNLNSAYALTSSDIGNAASNITICNSKWGVCETFSDSSSKSPTKSQFSMSTTESGQIELGGSVTLISSAACLSITGSCDSTLTRPPAGSISIGGTLTAIASPLIDIGGIILNINPTQPIIIATPIVNISPYQVTQQDGYGSGSLTVSVPNLPLLSIPEPSSYALLLAGISLLMMQRNKFPN